MVIPWVGFPLARPRARGVEPTSRAKYVAFQTLLDPEQMPGQRRRVLDWPYVEGLRIDEAIAPAHAARGRALRPGAARTRTARRCGSSCRGSTASRASSRSCAIRFAGGAAAAPPGTSSAPSEYGFYANVNPDGRPPALEPGHASGASASSAGARRSRSTATPTRWRASTRAWTCAASSDAVGLRARTRLAEARDGRRSRRLPLAKIAADARPRPARREPHRGGPRTGSASGRSPCSRSRSCPRPRTTCSASPGPSGSGACSGCSPSPTRRSTSLCYVGVDQFLDVGAARRGRDEAQVHDGGLHGVAPARAARGHLDRRLGAAARVRALEAAPPPRLRRRRCSAVVHFVWRVKADLRRPAVFLAALAVLLLARLVPRTAARRARAALARR